uniref:Tower domain-containing protein n=1 Tax=Hippocampus comes TaxID=109280 RepID=A0A3Q2YVW5_HIPCM
MIVSNVLFVFLNYSLLLFMTELGQLDPDWFQVLTTRASSKEGNLSDSDDQEELCPNQEANFKTPLRKTAAADVTQSQHSSIPRVFRRSYVPSPDNDDQQGRKMATIEFEMMQASYAQHICESLGADIHPDISWTSSLNTPPALPSTLIICHPKPSESDAGPHPTLQKSPRRSPEQSNGTRRQPLPEAIRSPTPSVPDGTENSPPMILTNSSSVLRQVKSERTRRMEEKEHGSSPSDVSIESELAFSEQRESDQALCRNPPVETEDSELTPWSPLPLSEIPATTVATQVEDKCPTQAESPVKASLKCAGFTQKKTAFIYTIDKEKHSLKNNSVQGISQNASIYDINESIHGSSSFVKPVQDATKSPGNANAVAHQVDQAFECARDATEEIPAASASASCAQNCDRSNCQLTASQKADVKALCTLLEEAGSQFDFTQFRTVKLKQPGKEASAPSSKADKDLEPHLLSGIDFEDSFCAEPNEKTTSTSCGTTHLEESGVARQPLCAHTTEKEERAEESLVRVSKKCLKKTKHLFQVLEASTPAQKQSVENDRSTMRTSRNEQQFVDGYDREEPLQGFFSSAIPDQSAPKGSGNMLASARQEAASPTLVSSQRSFSGIKHKTESLLDVCHEVEEHPVCDQAFERGNAANVSWLELDFSTWTGGGFSAAGGENASASAVALTKAKPLLQEDRGAHPSAEFKNGTSSLLEGVDHQPGGFRTAKGKRVAVSSAALKKAQLLLDDCSEVKEHPLCYPTATKSELPSASEKPGSFSDNSLFADDSLFDNLDCTPESPSVSDVKDAKTANATIVDNIDCPNDQVENGQCDNNVANCANPSLDIGSSSLLSVGGFSTASGNKVYVSAAALKKAKDLLQEDAGDALSSKMQHRSFLGVERADLAAASQNVTASSAALPTIKFLLDEDLAVEEHPGCSPPLGKSEFLSAREKPASFAAKSDLGSTLESPALTPHDSKRGNSTSKETLGGCFPIAGVTPKKASLPHKATLEADAHFKGMMDSHDGTSGKENPSIVGATAFTVKTDAQNGPLPNGNIRLHRDEEKPGNPSLDVACSSLSGARFSAASGSALPVSAAAMAAAKHFFQEDHEDDPSAKMKPGGSSGVDRLDCQAGGFQTAGGKRVTVSSAALTRVCSGHGSSQTFFPRRPRG